MKLNVENMESTVSIKTDKTQLCCVKINRIDNFLLLHFSNVQITRFRGNNPKKVSKHNYEISYFYKYLSVFLADPHTIDCILKQIL